jgi:excinuclease ABC subunit C
MTGSLRERVAGFPDKPGIYFFRDAEGKVLYIGKARSLRDRVRSYFLPGPDIKVRNILGETADIDYILTGSEKEAAFLENNYVQQHRPKFNLRLKDDKSFPYLKLTVREEFPGIYMSRKVVSDGSRHFGPFSPAGRARKTIHLVNRHFGVRGCEAAVFKGRKRPCLEHDLGLCSAPCVGRISAAGYRKDVEDARLFLEGRTEELARDLKARMKDAAAGRKFEEAARLRDLVRTLEDLRERPQAIDVGLEDLDAVGYARSGDAAALHVFFMRRGKVRDSRGTLAEGTEGRSDREVLAELIARFYGSAEKPPKILLPFEPAGARRLREEMAREPGKKARLIVPKAGKYARLTEMAGRNAALALGKREGQASPLLQAARVLGLGEAPWRIEGFDISNTGGDESVGSLVVFDAGVPNKAEYRKFKVKTVEGSNDVASLREVVRRRYARLKKEGSRMPGLILVDGGKPQLAAALEALADAGIAGVPVISLAKREEIIFTPEHRKGIRLDRTSPALKLIERVRDEAHRFAVAFHRGRRQKKSFGSALDGIPGLGPKRKAALLARYKGVNGIRDAPFAELAALIGRAPASALKRHFGL